MGIGLGIFHLVVGAIFTFTPPPTHRLCSSGSRYAVALGCER